MNKNYIFFTLLLIVLYLAAGAIFVWEFLHLPEL